MDFDLSDEQALLQRAVRGYLAEHAPLTRVRALMATASGHDATLVRALAGQGVTGVLVPAEHGGAGLGLLDAAIVGEELGRAATPLSFHSACVLAPLALALAGDETQRAAWLPRVASGAATLSFATLEAEAADRGGGSESGARMAGDVLSGSVRFVPDATVADAFVLVAGTGAATELLLLPRDTPGLAVGALETVDETRRVGELTCDDVRVGAAMRLRAADAAAVTARVLDAGRIALAADALGAAERSLELAVEYAKTRRQFGRVIGSFQAVKHMCAETFAEVEPVRALLWYAAFAWDERREDAPVVAALAKAHATEVATRAVTTCVQVFGGMGFTWECDMHLWFKRAGYDRQMLGSPAGLRARAAALQFG